MGLVELAVDVMLWEWRRTLVTSTDGCGSVTAWIRGVPYKSYGREKTNSTKCITCKNATRHYLPTCRGKHWARLARLARRRSPSSSPAASLTALAHWAAAAPTTSRPRVSSWPYLNGKCSKTTRASKTESLILRRSSERDILLQPGFLYEWLERGVYVSLCEQKEEKKKEGK